MYVGDIGSFYHGKGGRALHKSGFYTIMCHGLYR